MTFDISKYPEPEDYGEVLLRLMASPLRKPATLFPGADKRPGMQSGDVVLLVGEPHLSLTLSLYKAEVTGMSADFVGTPFQEQDTETDTFLSSARKLNDRGYFNAIEILAQGGLACGVADLALTTGIGASLRMRDGSPLEFLTLFGEARCQCLVAVPEHCDDLVEKMFRWEGIPVAQIEIMAGGDSIDFNGINVPLAHLRKG